MSVILSIEDGAPWYLSPSIWVVPGDDPNGSPGFPTFNSKNYVWSRVYNSGTTTAYNAIVNFYWTEPSSLITRKTAKKIGSSSVILGPGESKDVLCLTPWYPNWGNDKHICLITEVFSYSDPLPPHGDNDPFNPPADRHVAQRNIIVESITPNKRTIVIPFIASNSARMCSDEISLQARRAPIKDLSELKTVIGLEELPKEMEYVEELGITSYRCGDQITNIGKPTLTLSINKEDQTGMALVVRLPKEYDTNTGSFFLVEELICDEVVGGIGVLVMLENNE
ncbi:hypothetical protein [Clostridium sulfidigenes]|uniref:hypothetical protein n=1 Tax=Clostridium sulfidigenes TaxID=318464 RepID=UPI003F8B1304